MSIDLRDPDQLAARAPAYELAFTESGHALATQERAVYDLSSRAGVLMAAAAVTTSVFGGQVGATHHPAASWVAFGAFAGVAVSSLMVMWPRHRWEFALATTSLLAFYAEPVSVPLPMIHRDLAIHREASFAANVIHLQRLRTLLRTGVALLALEVLAWVVALAQAG